ncbi:MAG: adenylate/guanylate cyclase domain-containing protein [Gammaproteobacteria bacterium]|nr:adenylate/guanylate cyclase domain-containing protein [Gammaproteobacteria bacterium]
MFGFGERRHLTIMFCDMVGSTHLSSVLDPEELQSLIGAFHEHCSRIVDRYGGRVYQYLGDGALVYFGYPVAHENDAERTVLAALEILESIDRWVPAPGVRPPGRSRPASASPPA